MCVVQLFSIELWHLYKWMQCFQRDSIVANWWSGFKRLHLFVYIYFILFSFKFCTIDELFIPESKIINVVFCTIDTRFFIEILVEKHVLSLNECHSTLFVYNQFENVIDLFFPLRHNLDYFFGNLLYVFVA